MLGLKWAGRLRWQPESCTGIKGQVHGCYIRPFIHQTNGKQPWASPSGRSWRDWLCHPPSLYAFSSEGTLKKKRQVTFTSLMKSLQQYVWNSDHITKTTWNFKCQQHTDEFAFIWMRNEMSQRPDIQWARVKVKKEQNSTSQLCFPYWLTRLAKSHGVPGVRKVKELPLWSRALQENKKKMTCMQFLGLLTLKCYTVCLLRQQEKNW